MMQILPYFVVKMFTKIHDTGEAFKKFPGSPNPEFPVALAVDCQMQTSNRTMR